MAYSHINLRDVNMSEIVKTTGADLKAFYKDERYWIDHKGGALWHDDVLLKINGEDVSEPDINSIADDAVIEILSGMIMSKDDSFRESLDEYFTKWKFAQTHTGVVCGIPRDKLEEFKVLVAEMGGKFLA